MVVNGRISSRDGLLIGPGVTPADCTVTDTVCLGDGDVKKLGPGCKILRRAPTNSLGECLEEQRGATLVGLTASMAYVCRGCTHNAHNALCNRHGVAPPPTTAGFAEALEYFERNRLPLLQSYIDQRVVWGYGWFEKWPMLKRAAITASQWWDTVEAARVHAMVKRELAHKLPSKARLIQYYTNLATQALYGPIFYSLQKTYTEHFVRREVFPGIRVTFGSGMNAVDLGRWMVSALADTPNAHFYERDGKNWDSTMQLPHLELRLAAYGIAGEEFCAFVRDGFDVTGRDPRGALKYRLRGTVKSGHNDTTLGNSLVNAMLAATAMLRQGLRGDVIAAGDDLLAVIEGDFDAPRLAAEEATMGIVPEFRKFSSYTDVSFISGVWFGIGGGRLVFTPKPGRLLARLFWTVRPPLPKRVQQYKNGVVAGLLPTCRDMPIIREFLSAHVDDSVGTDACSEWIHRVMLVNTSAPLLIEDREAFMQSFCERYGLTRAQIADAELMFRTARGVVGFVSHPAVDRIMAVDLADLDERPRAVDF